MNPNQPSQNTKRKFSLVAQKNSVPYSDENGNFDQTWIDKFQGSSKQITLLSITTAPTGTFEKGSQYYNSTDKVIYIAIEDNVWSNTGSTPEFGIIYVYDNSGTIEYYIWDGDNLIETDLEKYQLKNNITDDYTSSSTTTYPSSKALNDGLTSKQDANLIFTNVIANNWEADSTYTNFNYKCEISNLAGITSSMTALVIFNPDDNINNDYANICLTGTDSITIYSKLNSNITIPKIIVLK